MNLEIDLEVESCVYKLWYGDVYLIVKGKTLSGSIYLIEKGYAAFIAAGGGSGNQEGGVGQHEWDGVNSYYFKFYRYMHKNPGLTSKVEVLLESNNPYELLKLEQIELQKSIRDKKCLNSNLNAYIPKYRAKTKSYGWINKGYVLSFKKFVKNS